MTAKFDKRAGEYERLVQRSINFSGVRLDIATHAKAVVVRDLVENQFGRGRQVSLLDVGCGPGLIHSDFQALGWKVTGVDVASAALEVARSRNPENTYIVHGGKDLPFASAAFDVALAVCVMHHVERRLWRSFVEEIGRVVRPGGLVIVIEHNRWNPLTRVAVARCPFDEDACLVPASTLLELMSLARLSEMRLRYFLVTPFLGVTALRFERMLSALPIGAQYCVSAVKPSQH